MLVFTFTLLLLCSKLQVAVSHPLDEHAEDIRVEGLAVDPSEVDKVVAKASAISSKALKEVITSDNADTKKHYYLFKIKEFYDFLPLYRQKDDRYLRLEIVDKDDMGFAQHQHFDGDTDSNHHEATLADHRSLVKRNVDKSDFSDATLCDNINVLQTMFLRKRKRDVSATLTVPKHEW
ncbi:uncharacterized protein [Euwallacea fornicatus]|uniref:uncharacterized protein n=1 Tax=Euwallacea fornicatus TaxID=995702 RepID=UPI00338DCAEE